MKLTDIAFRLSSYVREASNFIRHPGQILAQEGRRVAQDKLEQVEVPVGRNDSRASSPAATRRPLTGDEREAGRSPYAQPRSATAVASRPPEQLSPTVPASPTAWEPRSATIPLLSEQDQIRGRWGRYRRVGEVHSIGERTRCYEGILALNNKPVWIKEYLLFERDFNPKELRERKEQFAALTNLNLRNGCSQDFRLVNLCEAIASPYSIDHRCYLISEPIPHSQTLRHYLATMPTGFASHQVRYLLSQVLQTLWFLHQQKVRLPSGKVKYGLPHGNLSLDSLLIAPKPSTASQGLEDDLQFFVYATDLALWEHLFLPVAIAPPEPTKAKDLEDLGYIGFYLLTGQLPDDSSRPNLWLEHPWETVIDLPLKQFIRELVNGEFQGNAEKARQHLLHLPAPELFEADRHAVVQREKQHQTERHLLRRIVLWGLLGGFLGGLLWVGGRWLTGRSLHAENPDAPCCLAAISLPNQPVTYTLEAGSIWHRILRSPHQVALGETLEQALQSRDPRLESYTAQIVEDNGLAALQAGTADFILTTWQEDLPEGFEQQVVAYDAFVAVVAFSDGTPTTSVNGAPIESIPERLDGRITLEHLRQLYGSFSLPAELAERFNGGAVQLYQPDDPTAVDYFEQRVLQGDRQAIQNFRAAAIEPLPINQMFSAILSDFEQRDTAGIGFAWLSQVINQCSVYPLALGEAGREVQPLMQQQGEAIDPMTDLCGDKGSYAPNSEVFTASRRFFSSQYPLKYPLVIVYPQGSEAGHSFAEALQSDEGQHLLNAAGLVPLRPLRTD